VNTAVVTGGGRGMGRETARRLAQRGYQVLITDLDEAAAREAAEDVGGGAWAMAQDVVDADSHRAAAEAASERGPLKVWVNNAGILRTEKTWDHPDDDVRLIVDINVLGVIYGCRAAFDVMRADPHGCHIINMGSMSSFGPVPGLAVYGATKHAVLGFSESFAGDLRLSEIPIAVHVVCPDTVDTKMMRDLANNPEYALGFSGSHIYTAEEIADEIVRLLDTDRIILAMPRRRMWLARSTHLFPRAGLRLAKRIRDVGVKRQEIFNAANR
jgi:NAD(P)-dependent dehydrogenase (short-subunit alcohol dehydrogenase family)